MLKMTTTRVRLLAAVLVLDVFTAGGNPLYPPTSSWPAAGEGGGGGGGEQASAAYGRGGLAGLPRPLHFPAPPPDERYNLVHRRQYFASFPRRQLELKASPPLDYDLEPSYQQGVNMYQYSYTESTTYGDPGKYAGGSGRLVGAGGGARLGRRYGERVWWPRMPLAVLGARSEPYLGRVVEQEDQQLRPTPLKRPRDDATAYGDADDVPHYRYDAGGDGEAGAVYERGAGGGRGGGEGRGEGEDGSPSQNASLVGTVRVQKSLNPAREKVVYADVPALTNASATPRPLNRGVDSLLQMMSQADEAAQEAPSPGPSPTPQASEARNKSKGGGGGAEEDQRMLAHVGGPSEPQGPYVTTTVALGSIMLLVIIIVVMVALRVQWRERAKAAEEWSVRPPTVQPASPASVGAGPPTPPSHLDPLTHLHAEPIRIKAKGLLERRGSNTSLTLELPSTCPPPEVTSPPRHCIPSTPEEFLMTAGNRMSRRQLKHCLRDTRGLHAEFWEVPLNLPDKCDVPGSAAKNRYRTVLPNEATRVKLDTGDPATAYINANYVRGYDGEEKAYVVTQGPLANTVADLWALVMQERSPAVVMITRLKEKRRVKCEPYVPALSATYGDITVTVKQLIHKNGYTTRQLLLQRREEVHETLHFWYTAWPDHKTPTEPDQLLAMSLEVDHVRKTGAGNARGPVIVHCSAGIGRSGCFIAISMAINQLLEEDCVDILGILCQMRLDRGGMVQTGEQYEFIHRAVALYESTLPAVCVNK
ncbi:receptor-type tyrosine-protein phosphatase R-like isoform X1 [Penaeus japonicus]|uniref:receptor-type tyrosine-protein phosphatase R-like isoform X1 n=1 Tax=Penaeus japonicus TaxID=27405 RepID=UPI001C7135C0|nr:receptor-type tyrosine-protein phosphatase R-like isoform X1 [Penaeus japonicus]XP_042864055.1 receptor-type tyrosine-protein phosphatase R-like isoform X1 [Penaeus japonicus]XP_042864056.1 receptor-type tyrosine-protein phosphatase R-like isoform X1 [Penaeus japonicus]